MTKARQPFPKSSDAAAEPAVAVPPAVAEPVPPPAVAEAVVIKDYEGYFM